MNKNKLVLLIVVLCLSSRAMYCSQQPGYAEQLQNWLSSKMDKYIGPYVARGSTIYKYVRPDLPLSEDHPMARRMDYHPFKATHAGLTTLAAKGMYNVPLYGKALWAGVALWNAHTTKLIGTLLTGGWVVTGVSAAILDVLRGKIFASIDRKSKINTIKEDLSIFLLDNSLYPTRSSKINALLKKDEFIEYIEDEDGMLSEASNRLMKKLFSKDRRSERKRKKEEKIDGYISTLNKLILGLTLKEQVALLRETPPITITPEESVGYVSLYNRLKNRLRLEKMLSPEQRAQKEGMLPLATPEQNKQIKNKYKEWRGGVLYNQIKNNKEIVVPAAAA